MDIDPEELRNERLKTPFETGKKSKKRQRNAGGGSEGPTVRFRLFPALAVLSLLLGVVLAGFLVKIWSDQAEINRQLEVIGQQISGLAESTNLVADRLEEDQERMDSMAADIDVVGKRLGVTSSELQRARALAERLREEQEQNVQALTDQIREKADTQHVAELTEETNTKFDEIDGKIEVVKDEVKESRQEIEKTWGELNSLGLRLTEQGTLIATNSGGLEELRKRGEREYLQFNALKKRRVKIGDVIVELRKADQKKQRADLKLFYDDREVEKKQVYTNNPLTFFVGRDKIPYEFVINEVKKDEIAGYISVPLGAVPGSSPTLGTASGG